MSLRRIALAFVLALAGLAMPAAAQTPSVNKLLELIPPEPGYKVCYTRRYDAAHLRAHPKQQVTALIFIVRVVQYEDISRAKRPEDKVYFQFALSMQRRGEKRILSAAGNCFGGRGGIACDVDCDGGGVELERLPQGDALLMRLRDRGIHMYSDCDGGGVWVRPDADDDIFRLEKAAISVCRALEKRVLGD
jgi:hypothetical protein